MYYTIAIEYAQYVIHNTMKYWVVSYILFCTDIKTKGCLRLGVCVEYKRMPINGDCISECV